MSNTIITSDGKHHYIDKDEDRDKIDYEAGYHIVHEADEPVAPAPFLLEGSDSK